MGVENSKETPDAKYSEIYSENDFSKELNDFLSNKNLEEKKEQIEGVLLKNEELKKQLEAFLQSPNLDKEDKDKLINSLKDCKPNDIIIAGVIANFTGYKIKIDREEGNSDIDSGGLQSAQALNQVIQARGSIDGKKGNSGAENSQSILELNAGMDIEELNAGMDIEELNAGMDIEELNARMDIDSDRLELINNEMREGLQKRIEILQGYDDVNLKTQEEAKKVSAQIDETTKQELEKRGIDEDFIDNYILLRVTLNEVKKDSRFHPDLVKNFEDQVNKLSNLEIFLKNIDNACIIADTSLSTFNDVPNVRRELFHETVGNKSLRDAKEDNIKSDSHKDAYEKMFTEEMGEDAMFTKYGQFLEGNLKPYWEKYKNDYPGFMNKLYNLREQASKGEILDKEDKDFLSLPGIIKGIKEKMDNDTKNMIEELCIISQIKGLYRCMGDGNDFQLNKAREIQVENIDDNTSFLTLKGHINGIDISIRQNIKDPNAHLQTSTRLKKMQENNTFSIGGEFKDSKFSLPSENDIFTFITESIQSPSSPNIENFDNHNDYLLDLQKSIMKKVDKKYEDTKFVHYYMKEQVKGEKIINNTIQTVEKIKGSKLNSRIDNVGPNQKLYDFFNLIDFNVRNSSAEEKNKLDAIMDKIKKVSSLAKDKPSSYELNNYPPIIKDHLTGNALQNTSENLNGRAKDGQTMFDLFQLYKKPGDGELRMINYDYLNYDLFVSTNLDQHLGVKIPTIKGSPVSLRYVEEKEKAEDSIDSRLKERFKKENM